MESSSANSPSNPTHSRRGFLIPLFIRKDGDGNVCPHWWRLIILAMFVLISIAAAPRWEDLYLLATQGSYSDEERVELLEQTIADMGASNPRPAYEPQSLRGTFKWEGELPDKCEVRIAINSWMRNSGYSDSSKTYILPEDTEFELEPYKGLIWLSIDSDHFQDQMLGPFGHSENGIHDGIVFNLKPGISVPIQILDDSGKPASGVRLQAAGALRPDMSKSFQHDVMSNEKGIATLTHINPDYFYSFILSGSGFQKTSIHEDIQLNPQDNSPLIIPRATPATITVVDADGKPVPKVTFVKYREMLNGTSYSQWNGERVESTNEDGQHVLDKLADVSQTSFRVLSEVGKPTKLERVSPGDEVKLQLESGIKISGEFTVPDELMEQAQREPRLYWDMEAEEFNGNSPYSKTCISTSFRDGKLHYELPAIGVGKVELDLFDQQFNHDATKSDSNVNFTLKAPAAKKDGSRKPEPKATPKYQDVEVRFTSEGELVSSSGELVYDLTLDDQYDHDTYPELGDWQHTFATTIEKGVARLKLPEYCTIQLHEDALVGYAFAEQFVEKFKVTPKFEPIQIEMEVVPAGAVRIRVLDSTGQPTTGVYATLKHHKSTFLIFKQRASGRSWHAGSGQDGLIYSAPLPLGKKYEVSISKGHFHQHVGTVTLERWKPLGELSVQMSASIDVKVRVLDENEQPVSGLSLNFIQNINGEKVQTSFSDRRTDSRGEFMLQELNAESIGAYWVVPDSSTSNSENEVPIDLTSSVNTFYLVDGKLKPSL